MDFSSPREWINALWVLFGLYWLVSALNRKKTKRRETWGQRFVYTLPLVAAAELLVRPEARYGWLGARFVPANPMVEWAGVLLTAAGVAVAFWARWHLGAISRGSSVFVFRRVEFERSNCGEHFRGQGAHTAGIP